MSRLGKLPIILPSGVTAMMQAGILTVTGPKGQLQQAILPEVQVTIDQDKILVNVANREDRKERALWGLFHRLIGNMVIGVTKGYEKKLEINGVGYRVNVAGQKLTFSLGFSHPVEFNLPSGITATVDGNVITIAGQDKQLVGEVAAQIRRLRPPEPYKGKGIKYADEVIRRKAGKTAAK
ncbi:50S ribosomal protein L6 [Patescibacteria group bacterium]|jgi:large subunit ribosomal protein L6|nr:50S ribosomal protein L6 [Patescibacteria group bacterium]HPD07612.1 50S ribosomal protein L6 [bacterium]HRT10927.1 50S ribosomal protein L6 [Patescibacteria group bacterium]